MELILPARTFTIVRILLLLTRGACGIFLIATARLYWYIEHPYLKYFADLLAPPEKRHFRLIGGAFGCVGALHCIRFLSLVFESLGSRMLTTFDSSRMPFKLPERTQQRVVMVITTVTRRKPVRHLYRLWRKIFGRRGLLGVESEQFGLVFQCRELIEISSQIYQAQRFSSLISRTWINHFYVAVIVINCWSTPLCQFLFQHTPALERVVCLVVDVLLNTCTCMVLPLIIFIPYLQLYIPNQFTFSLKMLYDDVEFVNFVMENQSIFAHSNLDGFTKLVPHLSIFACLDIIQMLIRSNAGPSIMKVKGIAKTRVRPAPQILQVLGQPSLHRPTKLFLQSRTFEKMNASYRTAVHKVYRFKHIGMHLLFVIIGIVVIALHIRATRRSINAVLECRQYVQPWFAGQHPCALFEFNCYQNGTGTPSEDALDLLDTDALHAIFFTHCPAFVMPKSIQKFHNLLGIDLYNSTIVEWGLEAAISTEIHTKMVYIVLVRVNMTNLPEGLVQPLPEMLSDIELSITNLTTLPADLHLTWPSMTVLYVEHSQMTEFPSTLLEMTIDDLSLIGNKLQLLPDLSTSARYYMLALSHNPLEALPTYLDDQMTLGFLSLESTSLSELPDWVPDNVKEATYLYGSPVCDADSPYASNTACVERDPRGDGRYPTWVEKKRVLG